MGQLDGKVAIVTGAGRGIGKATAICYAREGASVVVASRTQATLDGVVKQITDEGGKAIGITCDVGHKDQIFAMVDKAVNAFGPIDILVNNAQGFGTEANPQKSTVFVSVQDTDDVELEYTFRTGALASLWARMRRCRSCREEIPCARAWGARRPPHRRPATCGR